jgi:hypothetical protein
MRASRQAAGETAGTASRIRLRRSVSSGAGQDGGDLPCRKTRENAAERIRGSMVRGAEYMQKRLVIPGY